MNRWTTWAPRRGACPGAPRRGGSAMVQRGVKGSPGHACGPRLPCEAPIAEASAELPVELKSVTAIWRSVIGVQQPPPGWLVLASAAVALLLVAYPLAWRLSRNVVTIAHEG